MQNNWIIAPAEDLNGGPIAWKDHCDSVCIARLLSRKGFASDEDVRNFLQPRLSALSDPFLLPQMQLAVERILAALDRREPIVVFGDYDVDGVTSLALLAEILRAYGGAPDLFLPMRVEEGYGLSRESLERCLEQHHPRLLIAVDCGTSSVAEITVLRERGVDVVVLDHHEPKSELPPCVALVNPKLDPASPFHYLCSAGLAFKLCHALLKTRPLADFNLKAQLDLVALATVADIVPLCGENRTLVQRGARELARTRRPGLQRLMAVAGVRPPILPEDIGFKIGPRLNAAGRLSTAEKALQLLLTLDQQEAQELATFLDEQNRERQEVEKQTLLAAEEKIGAEFDPIRDAAIVVGARGWHPGVVGIVASRLARKYHRPTIVVGFDEAGLGKGSGRSIEGLSLVEALSRCRDFLDKYGGHEMAAGLSLAEKNFPAFAEAFRAAARALLSDEQLRPRLRLDHELSFRELNFDFLRWHEMLQPFGNGNPQPLFFARGIEPAATPRVLKEKHLSFQLRQRNYQRRAVFFGGAARELPPPPWDIAFRVRAGEFEGEMKLDIHIQALRQSLPGKMIEISQALSELDWIPRPKTTALRRLGIETAEDLLTHYPRRYEDRHQFPHFPHEESDVPVCLCGEVTKTRLLRFGGWKKIFEATLEETNANALSPPLTLRWFNLHYVQKMIATGQRLVVFGKPRLRGKRLCLEHPEFEIVENDEESSIHFRRITPVYPATEGVSQRVLRSLIHRLLQELSEHELETPAPKNLVSGDRRAALQAIHFPESWEALKAARRHLVLSEFFALQMLIASRRTEASARPGGAHCGAGKLLERFLQGLPFQLTSAQEKVIGEIRHDLAGDQPMNRLLQGDVGSGKTVVAVAAILLAVEAGFQTALMAPTQILAEQHYAVLRRWLEPLGVRLALRTAARQEESTPLPLFERAATSAISGSALVSSAGDDVPSSRTLTGDDSTPDGAKYAKRRLPHFEKPWAIYAVTIATKDKRILSRSSRTVVLDALRHFDNERYELFAACVMPDHVHFLLQPWIKEIGSDGKKSVFWSLSELIRSLKSYSAHKINELEGTMGSIWEKERFDRYVRGDTDLSEKFRYIVRNPWDARIVGPNEDYPFVWTGEEGSLTQSSPRRDDAASTRDECATREQAGSLRSNRNTLSSDAPQIIIGTHALLYESVSFSNLGLVVIDEQHKFGVAQRARLTAREPAPDVLVMTATPIPRTLTMTVYGDLDVSIIDEMPANRGKIVTAARDEKKLGEVLAFLRKELDAGRQLYVIYPLIEESDKLDVKAAAAEYEQWKERLHPYRCELLHGRIPPLEKQQTMERFRQGATQVLVSTTVIEVGVDVPNATVMLVENAERFGLAQLHQLRGRIGRGQHKSYCILLSSEQSAETTAKLSVLEKTINGFEIAEADWDLRGPGDLLGTAQSGLPGLKIGHLKTDADLMKQARVAASLIFDKDPGLEWPENQRFRRLVVEQEGRVFSHIS